VCLSVRNGTDGDAVAALTEALRALPARIPEIRAYTIGADLGIADGNADLALVADFDDADAWHRYQVHPEHVRVLQQLVAPMLSERVAVQFEVPG
jgi:Stress responsive A/B Barrel Domain